MDSPLHYDTLRREGIRRLERLTDERWTDFNAHDPGITILEQVCFALADLGYRLDHDLPDLLAEGGANPYESLFPPQEVLTCHPVTRDDLRRSVLDVEGVRNAWIEPLTDLGVDLHYHHDKQELSTEADPPFSEPVTLHGLHRVLIQAEAGAHAGTVRQQVAQRLHEQRPLCQDFVEIRVLQPQPIAIEARVEIDTSDEPEALLVEIFKSLRDQLSPRPVFTNPARRLSQGADPDSVFEGPKLDHGLITDDSLNQASRRLLLNTSDLIHALTDIPGVRTVPFLRMRSGERSEAWALPLDPKRAPALSFSDSAIRLEHRGLPVHLNHERVLQELASDSDPSRRPAEYPLLPTGRDRQVGRYRSIRHLLPTTYGVGDLGLAPSAPPSRQAQARGLKAYLTFFDQLLAGTFAQVAALADRLSYYSPGRPHNSEPLDLPSPTAGSAHHHRLLDHLLARFAERWNSPLPPSQDADLAAGTDPGLNPKGEVARNKQAFLQEYPQISAGRGSGRNYLEASAGISGYARRLSLTLGLQPEAGERFVVVEHILLRPTAADQPRSVPLMAAADKKDPFSFRLSLVFPLAPKRFHKEEHRRLVEEVARAETPAHLIAHVHWLEAAPWATFLQAHQRWTFHHRREARQSLGLQPQESSSSLHESPLGDPS